MSDQALTRRRLLTRLAGTAATLAVVAACGPVPTGQTAGGAGPALAPGQPVRVALLVPAGSGQATDNLIARNLENAARLAVADLGATAIDLRVYATAGNPGQAATVAQAAVAEGAAVILGPLYAEEANAVGVATAGTGVNILAFSNNPTIAGGNVFILGSTFRNTADRLVRFGNRAGLTNYLITYADDLQGAIGREAIASAVRNNGASVVGIESYPLSQEGIQSRAPAIAAAATASGADAIFTTAGINADLPILATALPQAGLDVSTVRMVGLTRWNAAPEALALPGLQGGFFALPDQQMSALFESRYQGTYGEAPHPLASLAYDGIAAIGALIASRRPDALSRAALTQGQGFEGTTGIFRFLADGTNERGLAVAEIRNNQVVILEPAPRSFSGAGF